ncbi:MAG: FAD-dependent oxidoreductase [Paracoccus sp. (in: a-proteobacteria)]|nr:FAD-dependent oxidoreductase [Paracoccus sp. (in: a-proteobacteria)]
MSSVLILGAGMVGVSSALALQERGHEVVLIDRREPGRETSFGNAGFIQTEAVEPYAMPLAPADLARIALGRSGEVRWSPGSVLTQARALLAYAGHSRPGRFARAVATYQRLIPESAAAHAPWVEAAGADNLVRRDGYLEIHRTAAGLARAEAMADRFGRDYQVPVQVLDGVALAAAEPGLRQRLAGAVLWGGTWTCADPGGLVAAYAALFTARGGRIVQGDAASLTRDGTGWRAAGQGAEHAVIALGPWSPAVCARFGLRVPMVLKRGYHQHFTGAAPLSRPLMDADNGVVMTPMRAGLRICTAADLRGQPHRAPPQLARGTAAARDLLGIGAAQGEVWSGQRPCMPDMLPVVGAIPGQTGLWAHFGHGHQGFTLGPVTAAILADAMDGGGWPELAPARLG